MAEDQKFKILVVDDQSEIVDIYRRILQPDAPLENEDYSYSYPDILGAPIEEGFSEWSRDEDSYDLFSASQGAEAVELVRQAVAEERPFSVIFMDVRMPPGIDGVSAAAEIRKIDPDVEIVIVSGYSDFSRNEIVEILGGPSQKGKLFYLHKPFNMDEIKEMALALLRKWKLEKTVKEKTYELSRVHSAVMIALAAFAEMRDEDTGSHLKRVTAYTRIIAAGLGRCQNSRHCGYITTQYIEDIGNSSVLHDIGKIGIPDSILLKAGKLTEEEFEQMKTHVIIGGDVLAKAVEELGHQSFLTMGREIAYFHHEKFDGSGYPKGLKGEDIPLAARIMAIADVYDALTSDRPYRKALAHVTAYDIMVNEMGEGHFDSAILQVFKDSQQDFNDIRGRLRDEE